MDPLPRKTPVRRPKPAVLIWFRHGAHTRTEPLDKSTTGFPGSVAGIPTTVRPLEQSSQKISPQLRQWWLPSNGTEILIAAVTLRPLAIRNPHRPDSAWNARPERITSRSLRLWVRANKLSLFVGVVSYEKGCRRGERRGSAEFISWQGDCRSSNEQRRGHLVGGFKSVCDLI